MIGERSRRGKVETSGEEEGRTEGPKKENQKTVLHWSRIRFITLNHLLELELEYHATIVPELA